MSDFLQFVQANGIIVPDTFTPGRWIRCKTESQTFSFSRKRTVLQIQASAFADVKLKVIREARLLRTK